MNLPNKLTILRMIMIVPFVVFMLVPIGGAAGKWIALALFVIASLTDLLDGKLTTHTYLAPYIPAEKIVNIREYDTAALEAALTGGGE